MSWLAVPEKKCKTNLGLINESQNQFVSSSAFFPHSGRASFNDIKVMMEKMIPLEAYRDFVNMPL